jgi:transcriptional regulator with XRE-family HTH domain
MLQPSPTEQSPDAVQSDARTQRKSSAPPLVIDPAWRAGRKLAEARRQRGWTLEEVAERIRVRREFLEALEEMNVKLLPGKAYALAFLRSYARELGVEEKAIVDQFQDECALSREDAKRQIRNPASKPRRERPWKWAAAFVLAAAAFVSWRAFDRTDAAETREPAVASSPASVQAARVPAAAPVESRVVEIRALSEGWLEARGPDGTVFLSRVLRPGDVYRPDPSPGWTLHARDGGAFELYVNGLSAGLLGTAGMPVLGRSVDEIQPLTQAEAASPRS